LFEVPSHSPVLPQSIQLGLYHSSVELLSAAIKFHPNINGITIDDSEFLISQYADDSILILEDDLYFFYLLSKVIYISV
jgi:hypothetical protein